MKKLLFVTHMLKYTGSPRSTLRMCKVALELGYKVTVWSAEEGPFRAEFDRFGIDVDIVEPSEVHKKEYISKIREYNMAICNSILTSSYARIICRYIPTAWYIREATNLGVFLKNDPQRAFTLRHFKGLYCVSEYAATAIHQYTRQPIKVIHNCVEDESGLASGYIPGESDRVRLAQFGTLEHRKGYDILLDAIESLPLEYRDKVELYIAGISLNDPFSQEIIRRADLAPNVHYLGVLTGDDKAKRLSDMDVVVVASRDESCSLVVLEAAMLSKPIIVTENVGAKYMVMPDNGMIVKTDDAGSLKEAIVKMIDNKGRLAEMGKRSRLYYDEKANMDIYRKEMEILYNECERKGGIGFRLECQANHVMTSDKLARLLFRFRNV